MILLLLPLDRGGFIWEQIWNTDEIRLTKKEGRGGEERSILEARVWHV